MKRGVSGIPGLRLKRRIVHSMASLKQLTLLLIFLFIGDEDGDYLEENWIDVIRCVSQLELAQLIGTGLGSNTKEDKESSRHCEFIGVISSFKARFFPSQLEFTVHFRLLQM